MAEGGKGCHISPTVLPASTSNDSFIRSFVHSFEGINQSRLHRLSRADWTAMEQVDRFLSEPRWMALFLDAAVAAAAGEDHHVTVLIVGLMDSDCGTVMDVWKRRGYLRIERGWGWGSVVADSWILPCQ